MEKRLQRIVFPLVALAGVANRERVCRQLQRVLLVRREFNSEIRRFGRECATIFPSTIFQRSTTVMLRFTPCLILVLAVALSGCQKSGNAASAAGGPPKRPPSNVMVETVVEEEVTPTVVVVGTVTARRTSIVASGAEGKVDQFLVREGDVVEAGQPLSILNMVTTDLGIEEARQVFIERQQAFAELQNGSRPEEVAEARGRMEAARVTKDIAARKLARSQRLVDMGAVNQDDLDDARERAEAAESMFDAAKAHFDLVNQGSRAEEIAQGKARQEAQQNQVAYLLAEKEKRTTRAPFTGVIVEEHTESGQWLSKGAPVVTIADLQQEVEVIANVDQRDLPNVRIGAQVQVEIEAAAQREWTGTVASIVPKSDWESGSRTFPVKVTIKNQLLSAGEKTIPVLSEGMYARVTFAGQPRQARLVPKNAIIRSESGSKVFVALPGEPRKAKPVEFTEGNAFGDRVEVLIGALTVGEQVVIEGAERLAPFAELNIVDRNAAPPAGGPPGPPGAGKPAQ